MSSPCVRRRTGWKSWVSRSRGTASARKRATQREQLSEAFNLRIEWPRVSPFFKDLSHTLSFSPHRTLYSRMRPSRLHATAMTSLIRGGGVLMRLSVAVAAICLSIVGLSMADDARASIRKRTDIPAEELGTALRTLAKERGFQLMYLSDTVEPLHTAGAVGELTTDEALTRILSGTGMTYRYLDAKTVTILPASAIPQGSTQAQAGGQGGATSSDKEGKRDSSGGFRLAQVDQGQTSRPSTVEKQDEQASKKKPIQLEEVVVTGSRIPTAAGQQVIPVRSYTREDIERTGQTTISGFLNTVPDVS